MGGARESKASAGEDHRRRKKADRLWQLAYSLGRSAGLNDSALQLRLQLPLSQSCRDLPVDFRVKMFEASPGICRGPKYQKIIKPPFYERATILSYTFGCFRIILDDVYFRILVVY